MKNFIEIQRCLAKDGFSIDNYLAFYLKNRLYNTLQIDIYFPIENLNFKCSTFEVPWSNLEATSPELKEVKVDKLVISELYSSKKILNYLNDVAKFDSGYKKGLIQIGYVAQPINYRLMYSCDFKDWGVVYIESPDDGTLLEISQNICLLLSQGEINIHEANLKRFNGDIQNAVRNYTEDTWVMKRTQPT